MDINRLSPLIGCISALTGAILLFAGGHGWGGAWALVAAFWAGMLYLEVKWDG